MVNGEGCQYGLLKKLLVLRQSEQNKFYASVIFLRASSLELCEDHITHAAVNQHILAFQPPRYAELITQCSFLACLLHSLYL